MGPSRVVRQCGPQGGSDNCVNQRGPQGLSANGGPQGVPQESPPVGVPRMEHTDGQPGGVLPGGSHSAVPRAAGHGWYRRGPLNVGAPMGARRGLPKVGPKRVVLQGAPPTVIPQEGCHKGGHTKGVLHAGSPKGDQPRVVIEKRSRKGGPSGGSHKVVRLGGPKMGAPKGGHPSGLTQGATPEGELQGGTQGRPESVPPGSVSWGGHMGSHNGFPK